MRYNGRIADIIRKNNSQKVAQTWDAISVDIIFLFYHSLQTDLILIPVYHYYKRIRLYK